VSSAALRQRRPLRVRPLSIVVAPAGAVNERKVCLPGHGDPGKEGVLAAGFLTAIGLGCVCGGWSSNSCCGFARWLAVRRMASRPLGARLRGRNCTRGGPRDLPAAPFVSAARRFRRRLSPTISSYSTGGVGGLCSRS
jgi:hypothetical protein